MDKSERIGCAFLGCMGALFVGGLVVLVVIVIVARRESDPSEDPVALPTPPALQPWEPCVGHPSAQDSFEAPLSVADARHVDSAEMFEQAKKLALRLEPAAHLVLMSASGVAAGGKYDLTTTNVSVHFQVRCLETGKPPGQDQREGQAYVFVRDGKLSASRIHVPSDLPVFDVTPCGTAAAWRAVVGSGVPSEARATFVLSPGFGPFARDPIWIVDVPGHPDFRRQVEARTCRRVMRDGKLVH